MLKLLPDMALCLAAAAIFCNLILFDAPRHFFSNADSGLDIRTGQLILRTHTLPRNDPYSFVSPAVRWISWNWASDVIIGALDQAAGLSGVVWWFVLVSAAVAWLWARLNRAAGGNLLVTCALAWPMLATLRPYLLASPVVLSWIPLLWMLAYFEIAQPQFRVRDAALLVGVSAIWANIHPDFLLGPGIAFVYAIGQAARPWLWKLEKPLELRRTFWFLWAASAALAGSLINPYGPRLHAHILASLMRGTITVPGLGGSGLDGTSSLAAFITFAIAVLAAMLALFQKKLGHFLVSALLLGAALISSAALPLLALALLPLANGAITQALRHMRGLGPQAHRVLQTVLQFSDLWQLREARLSGLAWTPFWALLVFAWLRIPFIAARTGFSPYELPVYAAGELTLLPGKLRLLAPEPYNAYLIYRFQGRMKVLFDGRADLYGREFVDRYTRLMEAGPGWQEDLRAWNFTHALVPRASPLAAALRNSGWTLLFRDDTAALFSKPAS